VRWLRSADVPGRIVSAYLLVMHRRVRSSLLESGVASSDQFRLIICFFTIKFRFHANLSSYLNLAILLFFNVFGVQKKNLRFISQSKINSQEIQQQNQ